MSDNEKKDSIEHPTKQPLAPIVYAIISLCAFIFGVSILLLLMYKADDLIAQGISEIVIYILLIPLGLSAGAFLFGTMSSYASYKGKVTGGAITIGGPVVISILVVIGGFKLVPANSQFGLTVYVHGNKGKQDIVLKNEGEVVIDLGGNRRKEAIGGDGDAHFTGIPAQFRNQPVLISVSAKGFTVAKSDMQYTLAGESIYVELERDGSLSNVFGSVKSLDDIFLKDVTIRIGNLYTTTDENGFFILEIPPDRQKEKQNLIAYKAGYEIWDGFVYPSGGQEVKIILKEKK